MRSQPVPPTPIDPNLNRKVSLDRETALTKAAEEKAALEAEIAKLKALTLTCT